jgi:hypothetical protein
LLTTFEIPNWKKTQLAIGFCGKFSRQDLDLERDERIIQKRKWELIDQFPIFEEVEGKLGQLE